MKAGMLVLAACLVLLGGPARAEDGVTENEIRIGQTLPYSGPMSGYAVLGKLTQAYSRGLNLACKPLIPNAANLAWFEKFALDFKGFTCLLISSSAGIPGSQRVLWALEIAPRLSTLCPQCADAIDPNNTPGQIKLATKVGFAAVS
jgi:hypothetical protein